jgi:2-polyprenyl-3-methyl-5-hydroxy-6-metoxy-1,4-benzoquinol methylase
MISARFAEAETMTSKHDRAHGVTPGLRQDYATRTASRQAAFALPYLRSGMNLLDVGCGPGTITLGLAQAVAPGHVTGIDHDSEHMKESIRAWAEHPDAFFANVHVEVVGWKPG